MRDIDDKYTCKWYTIVPNLIFDLSDFVIPVFMNFKHFNKDEKVTYSKLHVLNVEL